MTIRVCLNWASSPLLRGTTAPLFLILSGIANAESMASSLALSHSTCFFYTELFTF